MLVGNFLKSITCSCFFCQKILITPYQNQIIFKHASSSTITTNFKYSETFFTNLMGCREIICTAFWSLQLYSDTNRSDTSRKTFFGLNIHILYFTKIHNSKVINRSELHVNRRCGLKNGDHTSTKKHTVPTNKIIHQHY